MIQLMAFLKTIQDYLVDWKGLCRAGKQVHRKEHNNYKVSENLLHVKGEYVLSKFKTNMSVCLLDLGHI